MTKRNFTCLIFVLISFFEFTFRKLVFPFCVLTLFEEKEDSCLRKKMNLVYLVFFLFEVPKSN